MDSNKGQVQRAGLLYVLASSPAPFAYLYVPGVLVVKGDALATADRVRASENLLRAGIVAELYGVTILVFAALALYQVFKTVDRKASLLMAAMMLVSVPISYGNVLNDIAPIVLLKNAAFASVLDAGQLAAQVMFFLRLHDYGLIINQIFWGLWLFPMGVLVRRSGFIPGWLAFPLFFAGAGYVVNSLGTLLLPPSLRWITDYGQVLGVGEAVFTFYLLIWGARGHVVDRVAALLVVLSFVIGTGALLLLNLKRIDATQYGVLVLVSLVATVGMVMRWRWAESSKRRSSTAGMTPAVP